MRLNILNIQNLINSGLAWQLEGYVGRTCMSAIENGDCMLGPEAGVDAYGCFIPSRSMVAAGEPGSIEWVIRHNGHEYAEELLLVPSTPMIEALITEGN